MMSSSDNSSNSQQTTKYFTFKRRIQKESADFFTKLDKISNKLVKISKRISILPSNNELRQYIRYLIALFNDLRNDIVEPISELEILLESIIKNRSKKSLEMKVSKFIIPTSYKAICNMFHQRRFFVSPPFANNTPQLLANILIKVDYDEESGLGEVNSYIQDIFERVFVQKNALLAQSLNGLSQALREHTSFSAIEGFVRAFAAKMIVDYKVTSNIKRLILCVQRLVYPLVYQIKPEFFPFLRYSIRKDSNDRNIEIEEGALENAIFVLNEIIFMCTPIDMINALMKTSSILVDGYMTKHNKGVGIDFGAQELLPLLEASVVKSLIPSALSIFSWLDKYCQEMECSDLASYIVTSFLTVVNFSFQEMQ